MLLHDYLRRMADIHKRANAEIETLVSEITDPKMKAKVLDWEPGDPITDNYPQVDQKTDEVANEAVPVKAEGATPAPHVIPEGVIGSLAPIDPIVAPIVVEPDANKESPELEAIKDPEPVAEVAKTTSEEKLNDTNHTV